MASMKKWVSGICTAILCLATGCTVAGGEPGADKTAAGLPVHKEEVDIVIPGVSQEKKLIWLSDLHIAGESKESDPEKKEDIAQRVLYSSGSSGMPAAEQWDGGSAAQGDTAGWVDILNDEEADLIVFGGDMLDYNYPEGTELLRKGFDKLNKPYIYARADHDMLPSYMLDADEAKAKQRQDELCKNEAVMSYDLEDLYLVVWNNSTSNLSDSGLERIKQLAADGRPMILATHVPIQPQEDESLDKLSRETFGDRILLWGYRDAYYWPDENTRALLDMIYDDDSPFVEILCGHLHFSWSGMVSKKVHQTVFPAAFERYMGVIHISDGQND